jgi:hypothetical protein
MGHAHDDARIRCVNEDVTADHRVVRRVAPIRADIAVREVDVIESMFARALRGKRQRSFVDVDAGHAAAAADQACRNHRQLSDAAADIEHAQTGRKTGAPQELIRQRIEN